MIMLADTCGRAAVMPVVFSNKLGCETILSMATDPEVCKCALASMPTMRV